MIEFSCLQEATGLAAFRGGKGSVLVASDAATRGMDVPGVEVVINYDTATYPKTYIHRAGRTARAGKQGGLLGTTQGVESITLLPHGISVHNGLSLCQAH